MKKWFGLVAVLTICLSTIASADAPENKLLKFKRLLSSLPSVKSAVGLTSKQRSFLVQKIESRRIAFYVANELQDLFKSMVTDVKLIDEFYSSFFDEQLASLNNCLSMMTESSHSTTR